MSESCARNGGFLPRLRVRCFCWPRVLNVRIAFLAAFTTAGIIVPTGVGAAESVEFSRSQLVIATDTGQHAFAVDIAQTLEQQAHGLMYRESMAIDAGMLFVFDPPRELTMWMKNTFISLDMIFVDEEGRVAHVARNTTPMSEKIISSRGPAMAVIELNAGVTEKIGLQLGDRVLFPKPVP